MFEEEEKIVQPQMTKGMNLRFNRNLIVMSFLEYEGVDKKTKKELYLYIFINNKQQVINE